MANVVMQWLEDIYTVEQQVMKSHRVVKIDQGGWWLWAILLYVLNCLKVTTPSLSTSPHAASDSIGCSWGPGFRAQAEAGAEAACVIVDFEVEAFLAAHFEACTQASEWFCSWRRVSCEVPAKKVVPQQQSAQWEECIALTKPSDEMCSVLRQRRQTGGVRAEVGTNSGGLIVSRSETCDHAAKHDPRKTGQRVL